MLKKRTSKNYVASYRTNGFKWLLVLLAGLPSIIIACWFYFGVHPWLNRIENDVNQAREINKNSFAEIQKIGTIDSKALLGMNIFNKEDIQSLKKILFALKAELDKTIELSHQDTINIVDRVNLYVTIGIVLLTLLGVFVPVIVQSFGSQEFKEKSKELNQKIKQIDDEVLIIPSLRLSYALLRATDKDLIRWYLRKPKKNRDFLKGIFEIIYAEMEKCREKKVLSSSNKDILIDSLRYFNLHLKDLLLTFYERKHLEQFRSLQRHIEDFVNNVDSNEAEKLFGNIIARVKKMKDIMSSW